MAHAKVGKLPVEVRKVGFDCHKVCRRPVEVMRVHFRVGVLHKFGESVLITAKRIQVL